MEKLLYVFKDDATLKRYSSLINKAEQSRDEHDWEEALDSYTEAISIAPSAPNTHYSRGCIYLLIAGVNKLLNPSHQKLIGEYLNNAIEDFNKDIEITPTHDGYYLMRGIAYKEAGKNDLAEENFNKTKEINSYIDIEKKISEYYKMIDDEVKIPTPQKIEVEANTLEEATDKLEEKTPDGQIVISKNIISDGKEKTITGMGETLQSAEDDCKSKIPLDAKIISEHEHTQPRKEKLTVEEFDEDSACLYATQWRLPEGASIDNVELVKQGKKGLLGLGKKANTYELTINQKAVIKYTIRNKAKIIARIGPKPKLKCNMCKISFKEEDLTEVGIQDAKTGQIKDLKVCFNCLLKISKQASGMYTQ